MNSHVTFNRRTHMKLAALAFASVLAAPFAASASEPFLKVDIIAGSSGGTAQSGWNAFNWGTGNVTGPKTNEFDVTNLSLTDGRVKVVIAAGSSIEGTTTSTARTRDGMEIYGNDFPYYHLYRDFITVQDSLYVRVSGLKAGKVYDFTVWCHDYNATAERTISVWRSVDGADYGDPGRVVFSGGTVFTEDTDLMLYATTVPSKADGDGCVTFHLNRSSANMQTVLNAFTLSESESGEMAFYLDFGDSTASKVQSGASLFYTSQTAEPRKMTYTGLLFRGSQDTVDVTLSLGTDTSGKNLLARDRDANGMNMYADVFPFYNAHRDVVIAQTTSMLVQIDGLLPEAKYELTLCPYDWSYGHTYVVTDETSGVAGVSRSFTASKNYVFSADTPEDALAVRMTVKSDANGRIIIRNGVTSGECAIAWLRLTYVPPKAGTMLLIY